jgi:hypothetical protein
MADSGARRSSRLSISRFFSGAPMPLEESRDGLSSIGADEEAPRPRRRSWFEKRAATDPMAAQHRLSTFNQSGADDFAAELFMPGDAEGVDSLRVSVQIGSSGIAFREPGDESKVMRTFALDTIVRWSKTETEFVFSFSEDLGQTIKKVRLLTPHAAAMVDACTRTAKAEMEAQTAAASDDEEDEDEDEDEERGDEDVMYASV